MTATPRETGDQFLDFDIELGEVRALPPRRQQVRISLDPQVYQQIHDYASSDTGKELGGILLGIPQETEEQVILDVTAMLKAKKTAANKTSLTFTHETWDQIHHEKEILYPDLKIVGWFHTHPGFGIFLSAYDLFIQQNFFNLPWQVAYVVDPVKHEQGFFAWEGSEIKAAIYRLGDTDHWHQAAAEESTDSEQNPKVSAYQTEKQIKRSSHQKPVSGTKSTGSRKSVPLWMNLLMVLLVLLLAASNAHRLVTADEAPPVMEQQLYQEQAKALAEQVDRLEQQLLEIQQENQEMGELVVQLSGERFFLYTVNPGDTLWSISRRFYQDPMEYEHVMRLNNLENPDNLEVGQYLLLYKTGD
ncbi:LysM peptidoglycan-binding domain-containing protein [Anoxynatronum sibiricum]|uniref:LysM peptidoglycan-binding domain-containing protein n=1 Tax=Anoxynatronum sibiricum TaxID=210623 RepID=A0ABU9VS08_9CLOT